MKASDFTDWDRQAVEWLRSVAGSYPNEHFDLATARNHCSQLLNLLLCANAIPPSKSEMQLEEIRNLGT